MELSTTVKGSALNNSAPRPDLVKQHSAWRPDLIEKHSAWRPDLVEQHSASTALHLVLLSSLISSFTILVSSHQILLRL